MTTTSSTSPRASRRPTPSPRACSGRSTPISSAGRTARSRSPRGTPSVSIPAAGWCAPPRPSTAGGGHLDRAARRRRGRALRAPARRRAGGAGGRRRRSPPLRSSLRRATDCLEMGNDRPSRGLWMFRVLLGLLAAGLLVLVVQRAASHPANADWLKLTEGHGRRPKVPPSRGASIGPRIRSPLTWACTHAQRRLELGRPVVAVRRDGRSLPPQSSRGRSSRSPARAWRRRLQAARVLDASALGPGATQCAMGAGRKRLPRRRREHGVRLGPRAVRDRRAVRADACYQCTPLIRLAIATCSTKPSRSSSFSPFAAAESGKTL